MRAYITIGVKLVALILAYNGLSEIPYFIAFLPSSVSDLPYDLVWIWPPLLSLALGSILFFKPHLITNRIDCEPKEATPRQEITFLRVGIILIGVYFLIGSLGTLYRAIWEEVSHIIYQPFWTGVAIVIQVYILLIPLYLIFGSKRIVSWILGSEKLETVQTSNE